MKKIKILFSFILVLLIGITAFGCGNDHPDDPTYPDKDGNVDLSLIKKKPTEIRVWIDDDKGEYMNAIKAEFNKVHPEIVIVHQHMGTVETREQLKLTGFSDRSPDIIGFPHDHLGSAVAEGLLAPLSQELETNISQYINPLAIEAAKFKGANDSEKRLYSIPTSVESNILFYNKKLVGTDPVIKTIEEAIQKTEKWQNEVPTDAANTEGKTNKDLGRPYLGVAGDWTDPYITQFVNTAFGFKPFGDKLDNPEAVGFETPEAKKAYKYMHETIIPKLAYGQKTNSGTDFENGLIPYIISGPWNFENYKNQAALKDNLGYALIPEINAGKPSGVFAGVQLLAIYKNSKKINEAQKFLEFMSSPKAMEILHQYKGKVPALKDTEIEKSEVLKANEFVKIINKQHQSAIFMPTIMEVQYYWGPAKTLLEQLHKSGADIDKLTKEAEASYKNLKSIK